MYYKKDISDLVINAIGGWQAGYAVSLMKEFAGRKVPINYEPSDPVNIPVRVSKEPPERPALYLEEGRSVLDPVGPTNIEPSNVVDLRLDTVMSNLLRYRGGFN